MAKIGRVRLDHREDRGDRWFLDFSPYLTGRARFLWSDRGHGFQSQEHAERVLGWIQGLHGKGTPLEDAVADYRRARSRPNLVSEKVELWLKALARDTDYAPYTLSQYRSYAKQDGHFSYWDGQSIYDVDWEALERWVEWLRGPDRELSGKSIRNVLSAFRGFYTWLRRRNKRLPVPEFPKVKRKPRKRRAMPLEQQAAAIAAIAEEDRGIFLALAHAIRPGEARAALVEDYDFKAGRLWIGEALKGKGSGAKRGETKTGEVGHYQVSHALRDWIERNVPTSRRFQPSAPLFANPRTGKAYAHKTIAKLWTDACDDADVDYVPPYPALKHSTITGLLERGLPLDHAQALARHKTEQTTRIYDLTDEERRAEALRQLDEITAWQQSGNRKKRATRKVKPLKPQG